MARASGVRKWQATWGTGGAWTVTWPARSLGETFDFAVWGYDDGRLRARRGRWRRWENDLQAEAEGQGQKDLGGDATMWLRGLGRPFHTLHRINVSWLSRV